MEQVNAAHFDQANAIPAVYMYQPIQALRDNRPVNYFDKCINIP